MCSRGFRSQRVHDCAASTPPPERLHPTIARRAARRAHRGVGRLLPPSLWRLSGSSLSAASPPAPSLSWASAAATLCSMELAARLAPFAASTAVCCCSGPITARSPVLVRTEEELCGRRRANQPPGSTQPMPHDTPLCSQSQDCARHLEALSDTRNTATSSMDSQRRAGCSTTATQDSDSQSTAKRLEPTQQRTSKANAVSSRGR